MVDVNRENNTIRVNVSSGGTSGVAQATNNAAMYWANLAQESEARAKDWANKLESTVDDIEYSSKYYALQSKEKAENAEIMINGFDTIVNAATTDFNSLYSEKSEELREEYLGYYDSLSEHRETIINDVDLAKDSAITVVQNEGNVQYNRIISTGIDGKQDILTAGPGINITNNVISNTRTSVEWGNIEGNIENQGDLKRNFLNYGQVSNCILEMPQNIKYEINSTSGQFKLLAGSKVYVSTNGTFEAVTLSSDTAYGAGGLWTPDSSRQCFIVYIPSTNSVVSQALSHTFSQTTAPTSTVGNYALWYNTNTKVMKCTMDNGATWNICSLPILVGRPIMVSNGGLGWAGKIDTVFNGIGFFEQYTFMLPEVKYLIPNGRNADGSLKNTTITSTEVKLSDETNKTSQLMMLTHLAMASTYGVNQYYEQDTAPTKFWNANAIWYDTANNYIYTTNDSGATWQPRRWVLPGRLIKTSSTGRITSMSFEPTFRAITANDVSTILNSGLYRAQNGYFKLDNGLIIQWGVTGTQYVSQHYTVTFPIAFNATPVVVINEKGFLNGEVESEIKTTAVTTTNFNTFVRRLGGSGTDGSLCQWIAIGY